MDKRNIQRSSEASFHGTDSDSLSACNAQHSPSPHHRADESTDESLAGKIKRHSQDIAMACHGLNLPNTLWRDAL